MTDETLTPTKPDDYLTVTYKLIDEEGKPEPKELFMSAGLVRRLASLSQSHAGLIDLYTDPSMQAFMIAEILKPRSKRGQALIEYTLDDFEISTTEAKKVSDWAIQHIIYFFTEAVLNVRTAVAKKDSSLMKLAASLTGSQDLQEPKQSAGPSTEN